MNRSPFAACVAAALAVSSAALAADAPKKPHAAHGEKPAAEAKPAATSDAKPAPAADAKPAVAQAETKAAPANDAKPAVASDAKPAPVEPRGRAFSRYLARWMSSQLRIVPFTSSGASNCTGVARRRKAPRASLRPLMRP